MHIIQLDLNDKRQVDDFLRLPFSIYKNIPQWVPPLQMDERLRLNPRRFPFYKHSLASFFIAYERSSPVDKRSSPMEKKNERVGVYVCHCGSNIAGVVDVVDVANWAAEKLKHQGVVIAREYKFMCSSLGQELIEKDIKELGLTRVVVAACSPHLHEKTFRTAAKNAGLNPY